MIVHRHPWRQDFCAEGFCCALRFARVARRRLAAAIAGRGGKVRYLRLVSACVLETALEMSTKGTVAAAELEAPSVASETVYCSAMPVVTHVWKVTIATTRNQDLVSQTVVTGTHPDTECWQRWWHSRFAESSTCSVCGRC
ncbi:hypothetical protein DIPPA_57666 [Diplonema papillatum]|nr:hypothetical protein DIPPA_57666 [Diplonema papillatum]